MQKSEMSRSESDPISANWGELGIPKLVLMFLMKCYYILQNARVTVFTISKLLSKN